MILRVSIDPGISGTGVALWDDARWHLLEKPLSHHILTPRKPAGLLREEGEWEWPRKAVSVMRQLEQLLQGRKVVALISEWPQIFLDNPAAIAACRAGSVEKNAFLVGMIAQWCWSNEVSFTPIPVKTWKGQLPKSAIEQRLLEKLPDLRGNISSHAIDAVAIGLWSKGLLHASQREGAAKIPAKEK